ncbi:MAG: dihydropteroate synthase [Caulobacteraceae bacterium]
MRTRLAEPSSPATGAGPRTRPLVFGIVNLTPDSFHDGGRLAGPHAALEHARRLNAEGADVLDIGGESTRPGAAPVSEAEETARVVSAIEAIAAFAAAPLSIDTMKPAVARAAMAAGASIWNDVTALRWAAEGLATAAELGCGVVLMHMLGEPSTMQADPRYDDVVEEVACFLASRAEAAIGAGVERRKIWLDPGIGFGKTAAHNLALLAGLDRIVAIGFPVLLGVSRKGFIRAIDPSARSSEDRLGGSLAAILAGARSGVSAVRVHDVAATIQALSVAAAIEKAGVRG